MGMAHLTGRLRCPRVGNMTKIPRAFNVGRLAGAGSRDYFARTGTCRLPARRKPPSKLCATLRPSERMRALGWRFLRLETRMRAWRRSCGYAGIALVRHQIRAERYPRRLCDRVRHRTH